MNLHDWPLEQIVPFGLETKECHRNKDELVCSSLNRAVDGLIEVIGTTLFIFASDPSCKAENCCDLTIYFNVVMTLIDKTFDTRVPLKIAFAKTYKLLTSYLYTLCL